ARGAATAQGSVKKSACASCHIPNRASPAPFHIGGVSLLFHHALQRMLMFAGKVHHLRHLGLGHLVGVDAAFPDAVLVDVHHDAPCGLGILVEELLEHVDHEFHWGAVI